MDDECLFLLDFPSVSKGRQGQFSGKPYSTCAGGKRQPNQQQLLPISHFSLQLRNNATFRSNRLGDLQEAAAGFARFFFISLYFVGAVKSVYIRQYLREDEEQAALYCM